MKISFRQYWTLLAKYLHPQRLRVALLAGLLGATIVLQLFNPQILRYFIDQALGKSPAQNLVLVALLFIVVAIVTQIFSVIATYVSENVGWSATNLLRSDVTSHCLGLDMSFHNNITPGVLIERIDGDISQLAKFFSEFVIRLLGSLLLLVGVIGLLFLEDWRVGAALLVFVTFTLFILVQLRNLAIPQSKAEREAVANLYGFLEERLGGLEDVRSNGASGYVMQRFYQISQAVYQKTMQAHMYRFGFEVTLRILFTFCYVMIFGMGAWLFFQNSITIGTVYLFFQYTQMLRTPLEEIARQLQHLQKAGAGLARVSELYQKTTSINNQAVTTCLTKNALGVELEKVSFGYNEAEPIIKNVSFRLAPGKVLGLLGRTGSGKTTITRLLFRLYDPQHGIIRIGDVDLKLTDLADLRRQVGIVTQEVQLFHATVRDNLTFFEKTIGDDQILGVLQDLGLTDWYAKLPNGLDTLLQAGGGGLSAGEAQLLAFTRVFLKNPGLVILDEASSRLDRATEQLIEQAVDKLLRNRTGIVIAHRLSTVQRADQILILEDGQLKEYGNRLELASDTFSHFHALLQTGLEEVLV